MESVSNFLVRKGLKTPLGIHSFFPVSRSNSSFSGGVELITAIASALFFRHYIGPIVLYTDTRGSVTVKRAGLSGLYDDVRYLDIPESINLKAFWQAGKIFAYQSCKTPYVSVDLDAILYCPFWRTPFSLPAATALHVEPREWECYANNRRDYFSRVPEPYRHFIERSTPHNTAVLAMFDSQLNSEYTELAIKFMTDWSASKVRPKEYRHNTKAGAVIHFEELVFAEQRLLSVVALKQGKALDTISPMSDDYGSVAQNPVASHLWRHKDFLRERPAQSDKYIRDTVRALMAVCPSAAYPFLRAAGFIAR